ncbi:MAG: hypothetical protein HN909_04305 [Phycisphaerales bacterium]|nr:hypothetical protein [Phycisphaerales bacterium]MBT7170974.1 hypothetical protein [Phycisphaerales bacterium]
MPFFTGEHETTIGAKRRLPIASALREEVLAGEGRDFYLVLGPDRRLWLYPDEYYRTLASTMKRSVVPSVKSRGSLGLMTAMARLIKPDAQGRVVLPEKSLQRAGLTDSKEVTLVGEDDHIVIWPTSDWEDYIEASLDGYAEALDAAAAAMDAATPPQS